MALKQFKPVTASLRGTVLINRSELWKGKPVKLLTEGKSKSGGRNNHGRTTSFFRGGGHKQSYRLVDFKRRKFDVPANCAWCAPNAWRRSAPCRTRTT